MNNNETRPVLDKYDSQILLMSKGHFRNQLKDFDFTFMDVLRGLWAWRCGIRSEYVESGAILGHCIGILERLGELSGRVVRDLLFNGCFNDQLWKIGIQDKETPMVERLLISCMNELSTVQVNESIEVDGETTWEPMIILEEKDDSFIEEMIKERADKEENK